ncbi:MULTISPECIES: competence protein CoiA family protein [unclassified Exiguobacterium]|uniref:competence protein CoiA n=1 Tax=unclassified Exiguobacterium TaxID=2644629 RepID=UPI001BE628A1|nr:MULTISPECIES: competence protein CoiA family protein [unclassified Exiguobacterium]
MRFAIGREGDIVDSFTLNRMQAEQLAPFRCPTCQEVLILKQGAKRRLHFAHIHTCGSAESVPHHQDKWAVSQWLQERGYPVDQEVTIGARRADILTKIDGKSTVIEIQASSLRPEEYVERTSDYEKANLDVIWLASGLDLRMNQSFQPWMRLELSRRHMLMTVNNGSIVRFNGFPISIKYGIGNWEAFSSAKTSPFEAYYRFNAMEWTEMVRRKRMAPPYPSPKNRRLIFNRLYPLGLLPALLPTGCYLPLTSLWGIRVHPLDFQTVLYLNRYESPNDSIEWSIEKTCRQFGVTPTSDFSESFHVQWKQLLNACRLSCDVRSWSLPITYEGARHHDTRLFQGFQRLMLQSTNR